jgi:hypothetical protein
VRPLDTASPTISISAYAPSGSALYTACSRS